MLLEIYKSKATSLLALFRNGDVTYDEFSKMKDELLNISAIEEQVSQQDSTYKSSDIVTAVLAILSVIK